MAESVRDMTSAIASGDTEAFARFYEQWFDVAFCETRRVLGLAYARNESKLGWY